MRKGFLLILVVCLSLLTYSVSFAQTTLTASATINAPTGVNPVAIKVMGTGKLTTDWADTTNYKTLSFDPLTLNTFTVGGKTYSVFLPDHFFSIDMAYTYTAGASIGRIQIQYTDINPPQAHGLGWKSTATFVRKYIDPATGSEATETISDRIGPGKILLKDVNPVTITLTQLASGWLRVYVGVVTKDPALPAGDVELLTTTEVFSPGDAPGSYTGTIVVTTLP